MPYGNQGGGGGGGSGNVVGPISSVPHDLAGFKDATGKVIEDSGLSPTTLTAFMASKNAANGIAGLNGAAKIPMTLIDGTPINYVSDWNALTNTPTLTSGAATPGFGYRVSVAGNTNLDGITDWQVGDWAVGKLDDTYTKWDATSDPGMATRAEVGAALVDGDKVSMLTAAGAVVVALMSRIWTYVKTKADATYDVLNAGVNAVKQLALGNPTVLIISGGVVTKTQANHLIDTEASAPTDNLDTISGGASGDVIMLRLLSAARVSRLTTSGNIALPSGMTTLELRYDRTTVLKYDSPPAKWQLVTNGAEPADSAIQVHIGGTGSPHTAAGVGAEPAGAVAKLALTAPMLLTIAAGVVTKTQANNLIETESGAGTDNLDTISGGSDGDVILLRLTNVAHVATLTLAGNILLPNSMTTLALVADQDTMLKYSAALTKWQLMLNGAVFPNDTRLADERVPTSAGIVAKIDGAGTQTALADADKIGMVALVGGVRTLVAMTGAAFKALFELAGAVARLALGAPATLTIAAGAVTKTQANNLIETESGAGTDELDTILGGADGDVIMLRLANAAHVASLTIVGNILLPNSAATMPLSTVQDTVLKYDGTATKWKLVLNGGVAFNDARLADARTPTAHNQNATTILTTPILAEELIKSDGSALASAGLLRRWATVPASKYTAAPASTSRLTMSDTSDMRVGACLKYTVGGTVYVGFVTAISANAYIDVAGASLGVTTVTLLQVSAHNVTQFPLYVNGVLPYGDGADADLLKTDMNAYESWRGGDAWIVGIAATHFTPDTGANQPKVNAWAGTSASKISTQDSGNGIQLTTQGAVVVGSAVTIDTATYAISRGSALGCGCTVAGTNANASALSMFLVIVEN